MDPVEARFKYLLWLSQIKKDQEVVVEVFQRDFYKPKAGEQFPGTIVHIDDEQEVATVRFLFQNEMCDMDFSLLAKDNTNYGEGPYVGYHPAPLFVVLPKGTSAVHSDCHYDLFYYPWAFWPEGEYEL